MTVGNERNLKFVLKTLKFVVVEYMIQYSDYFLSNSLMFHTHKKDELLLINFNKYESLKLAK